MCNYTIPITFCECPGHKPDDSETAITEWKGCSNHPVERMRGKIFKMKNRKPINKNDKPCRNDNAPIVNDICEECYERYGSDKGEILKLHLTAIFDAIKGEVYEPPGAFSSMYNLVLQFLDHLSLPSPEHDYHRGPLPVYYYGSGITAEEGCRPHLEQFVFKLVKEAWTIRSLPPCIKEEMEDRFHRVVQLCIERKRLEWLDDEERKGRGVLVFQDGSFEIIENEHKKSRLLGGSGVDDLREIH